MDIKFCVNEELDKIKHFEEYGYIFFYYDNLKIKKTIDYRYYRNKKFEMYVFENYAKDYYFFKREPKYKYYFYDIESKRQFYLSKNKKYLFVGSNNEIEVLKTHKYSKKINSYYC
jgi:hypothetical protein